MQLDRGGLVFDVRVAGPVDAPVVLLLHGFPQTSHCWRSVVPLLPGFRVVAPTQRGYSRGARPAEVEDYRLPLLVGDALGVLDALEVDRAHVVGHDWGAAVAWQLGARHASRVRTLTAVSVPHPSAFLLALSGDADQRARSTYMKDFAQPGYDQVLLADGAAGLRELFGGMPPEVDIEAVVAAAQEPGALRSWLSWYAAQRREDVEGTPAVTVPTLHVWSDQDAALGRTGAELTGRFVTGPYRFAELAGISHWIPEQAPEQLAALLLEHLA